MINRSNNVNGFFLSKNVFDKFIGIDWSGDKNNFQKGISVAECIKEIKYHK